MRVDDCPPNACTPGGVCQDGIEDYTCTCNTGFSGTGKKACTNINDCPTNACGPYGTCEDGIGTYSCRCNGPSGTSNNCPYRDNGDGTIYDSTTGYTWQKTARTADAAHGTDGGLSTNQAECARLSLAGSGWRLPTETELLTTKTLFPMGPDTPGCLAYAQDDGTTYAAFYCGVWQGGDYIRCTR